MHSEYVTDHRFVGKREWGLHPAVDAPCQKVVDIDAPTHDLGICRKPYHMHKVNCASGLVIKGESFPCDMGAPHDGWAHSSMAAEAIWGEGNARAEIERYRLAQGARNAVEINTETDQLQPLVDFARWVYLEELGGLNPKALAERYLREKGIIE